MKEKLLSALGNFGLVLYYIIRLSVSILPLVMIDANFVLTFLFCVIMNVIPLASPVFWVWGLVCAVSGTQDWMAIVYYICFGIIFLPFIIDLFCSLFVKKLASANGEEPQGQTPRILFYKIRPLPIIVALLVVSVGWNVYQYAVNDSLQSELNVASVQLEVEQKRYSASVDLAESLRNKFNNIADNYAFWESHACVVPIGSSTYHVFPNCPRCDTSSFYIYNTEQAENLGYSICPLCDIMN